MGIDACTQGRNEPKEPWLYGKIQCTIPHILPFEVNIDIHYAPCKPLQINVYRKDMLYNQPC